MGYSSLWIIALIDLLVIELSVICSYRMFEGIFRYLDIINCI